MYAIRSYYAPQDVKVAAKAAQMIYQAQQQLVAEKSKGNESDSVDSLGSASISSPLDQVISGVSVIRITSYNVCYTKLLRFFGIVSSPI